MIKCEFDIYSSNFRPISLVNAIFCKLKNYIAYCRGCRGD